MNANELTAHAELIWSELNTIEGSKMTREEQIDCIKGRVIIIHNEGRQLGRRQVINYMKDSINTIEST